MENTLPPRYLRRVLTGALLLAVLTLSLMPTVARAGGSSVDNSPLKFDGKYFKGWLTDSKNILTSPTRFERPEWIKLSLILAGGVTLYLVDENIKNWTLKHKNSTTEDISILAEHMGDGRYLLVGLGGFYLIGQATNDIRAHRTAMLGLESFAISGIFTQILKFGTHRHRPKSGDPHDTWDGPGLETDNLSFNSGHTAVAWAVATVIATEYKDTPYVAPVSYTIATLAALSRVHDNKHWASDIFIGAALGYFTSKAVISYHRGGNGRDVSIMPAMDSKGISLVARYRF